MTSAPVDVGIRRSRRDSAPAGVTGYDIAKRAVDLFVSVVALALLAVPLLVVALVIKLDSPGPVLFKQERAGGPPSRRRRGTGGPTAHLHTFRLYKFRSMVHDADEAPHRDHIRKYVAGDISPTTSSAQAAFKMTGDDRVTRVGRFIRQTSIDELPQLLNVVRGDMSLVGPRPVPLYEVAHYQPNHLDRFAAIGGISGLWQVSGRANVSFEEMIQMDIDYIERRSMLLDIKIMVRTVPTLLARRGAA